MRRKGLIWLLLLVSAFGCVRPEMPDATLLIEFETGALQTKSAGDTDGSSIAFNDDKPDLIILVADSNGDIVRKYNGLANAQVNCHVQGEATGTRVSVSFENLTGSQTYTVYAFANTQGLWAMKNGENTVTDLTALSSSDDVENLLFEPAQANLTVESRLPLSAKGRVTLREGGNGELHLSLLRCCAKVTAVFENQYGDNLTLNNFSSTFVNICPAKGYVIPHENDFAVAPVADATDDLISTEAEPVTIQNGNRFEKSWYVFPSLGPYTCDVSFNLLGTPHSYSQLPVHDDHARNITQIARNQHLTITTRIGKGKKVSFYFEVADWNTSNKTETVTFE